MRSDNILMTPTRAVVIDFGQAIIRQNDMDNNAWTERVMDEDEVEALRRMLHGRITLQIDPAAVSALTEIWKENGSPGENAGTTRCH
jgi:hypothetical protein